MKYKRRIRTFISILLHALILMAAYILQGAIFPFVRIFGLVPLLIPAVVAGIALYEGRDTGGICGLFGGILCDISFNQPAGTFTVTLTVIGLGIGILSDTVILSSLVSYYLSCAATLIICAFVQMTPLIATVNTIPVNSLLFTVAAQTFYTLILALPLWFPIRALSRRSQEKPSVS